jgi:hypothetical protein
MGLQSVTLTAFCSGLGVAPIAEVFDSDFASEEPVSRVFAQRRAELDTGAELGTFFSVLAERDEIHNFCPPFRSTF